MVDTDFERRAALLTNKGYFDRVRELSATLPMTEVWKQVESELPHGLRRFSHYISFQAARGKEANGTLPTPHFTGADT